MQGFFAMKTILRAAFLVALVSVAFLPVLAMAQQKGRGGLSNLFGSSSSSLLGLANNEAVQKDIGLSGDIIKKLSALYDEYNATRRKEMAAAGINVGSFRNMSSEDRQKLADLGAKLDEQFAPKVKELLVPDEFKRLRQIQLQAAGSSAYADSEVVKELSLTDEQQQKLAELEAETVRLEREIYAAGGDFQERIARTREMREQRDAVARDVLTTEQAARLASLRGQAFDVSQISSRRGKN
jgi:hypothetical protein